jgi:hypothetical protein
VFDDVERRRFLVQPAGKDPLPLPVRPLGVDLDERAGQLLFLPWSRGLTGAETDDHVLPARRLPRVKRHILDDAVALVEDAEHRDALRHRSDPGLVDVRPRTAGLGDGRGRRILLIAAAAACGEAERAREQQ